MPTVKHPLDTQNFEKFDEQLPAGMSVGGMKRWARADPNFVGYTYKNWEAVQPGAHDGKPLHTLWSGILVRHLQLACIHNFLVSS